MKCSRVMHQILEHLCFLFLTKSPGSVHLIVCMRRIFPAVCVVPVIFQKLMSQLNLCFKFCLEVIDQIFKLLWMPCSTDLGMLGQIIHYGKMRPNLLQETWNTTMPIFRDQIWVTSKLVFTHIIQDSVNGDWQR